MLAEKRDYVLDEIIKHGIDVKNRIVYFGEVSDNEADTTFCDVSSSSIEFVIRKFNKFIAEDITKPIYLWMSSRGGDCYELLRLCDRIETCPCPVIFYGGGRIMSAAAHIMSVCDVRNLFKNSTVLVHHGSMSTAGTYTDAQIDMIEEERLAKICCKMFADNTFIQNVDFWDDLMQRDVVLTPEEAIEIGLADNIIEPIDRNMFRAGRLEKKMDQEKIDVVVKDLYKRTKRSSEKITITPTNNVNSEIVEQMTAEKIINKKKGRPKKIA